MEKSMAEGSQTFEQDIARLIVEGTDRSQGRPGLRRLADQPDVALQNDFRLAEQLIPLPSVTPFDAGCIELIVARLQPLGFACEVIESGPQDFRVGICGQNGISPASDGHPALPGP
jgi:hypothetical protein